MKPVSSFVRSLFIVSLVACGGPRTTVRMTTAGHAEEPAPEVVAAEEEAAAPHAWLWEVSGGDAQAPSYVLGTMHIGVRMNVALPPPLDAHLYDARTVVMEIDPREAERMFASAPARRVPRREWLDRALARPTWDALVAELGDRVPAEILRQLSPGMLTLYLAQVRMAEVEAVEEGREPVRGAPSSARLDASIFDWTIRRGTPFVPLETPEEAMAALGSLAVTDALADLTAVVDRPEEARNEQRALRDAYVTFDEPRLLALLADAPPEFRDIVLLGRNRAWMPHLLPEIAQGGAFVAVGVGHLVGEDSVLDALEAAGYTVRRIGREGGTARE